LVEREAQRLVVSAYMKLASPTDMAGIEAMRTMQGKIEGIKAVLAIPRRMIGELEKHGQEGGHK